jgi:hypothetical protein
MRSPHPRLRKAPEPIVHRCPGRPRWFGTPAPIAGFLTLATILPCALAGTDVGAERFQEEIQPMLVQYCYPCHGDGMHKGGLALDRLRWDEARSQKRDVWWSVLKNVRAGIMPPASKPRPSEEEQHLLAGWIKRHVFGTDPANPDPGRVTIRRLNRVEYRNTIRDLTGCDFKAEEEFPPDDTGYGFDTIADVLTVSPLLLEKYLQAAETIVAAAVPTASRLVPDRTYRGREFRAADGKGNGDRLSFHEKATVSRAFGLDHAGDYRLELDLAVDGSFAFDPARCTVACTLDNRQLFKESYGWQDGKTYHYAFQEHLPAGEHNLILDLSPMTPPEPKRTRIDFRVVSAHLVGPLDPKFGTRPANYGRFFFRDEPPPAEPARREYARDVLRRFASKAFRRPVDDPTANRLAAIAAGVYSQPGQSFEQGVARAMVAVLASPRFVFRVEETLPAATGSAEAFPLLDEYSLASRLSYFFWSTLPDEELFHLAEKQELRKNLRRQVSRLSEDGRFDAVTRNFLGQWLEVRDVEGISINPRAVLRREGIATRVALDGELRRAIRRETEMLFARIARENRSVLELIDCDYTFVNSRLAQLYGMKEINGSQMRQVSLPKDGPRGGVLTHASVLMVTSNPNRTSPVKRGQFILDNVLGTPAPPPPATVPPLEDSRKQFKDREPTTRELMAAHRSQPLCNSCHSRMDPLGLALDNFNALGMWRDSERGQPIDASGKLLSGEAFHDVRELKRILKDRHRLDFYRCLTEKLLTYAIGRGLDYNDVETVDKIVERLDRERGRFSALLLGVVESAPFQRRREPSARSPESDVSRNHRLQARGKP